MQKFVQTTLLPVTQSSTSEPQEPKSQSQSNPKINIQMYDAEFKEKENIYVDNLDIYYTKNSSPCLYCKCNEENTTSIVYTERSKFKAHITTKKHKMWLKQKNDAISRGQPVAQSVISVPPVAPGVAQDVPHVAQLESSVAHVAPGVAPRHHAPRVSELRYFMVWTMRTHQIMREIEERLPIVV